MFILQANKHSEKLFQLIDIDGDGNLTETEFLRVSYNQENLPHQRLKNSFE